MLRRSRYRVSPAEDCYQIRCSTRLSRPTPHTSSHANSTAVVPGDRLPCIVDPAPIKYAADIVQLQHFNRNIPFYMLLSDTRAFVNKVAGSGGHGLPGGWHSALSPHDVDRNGCQGSTIIIIKVLNFSGFRFFRFHFEYGLTIDEIYSRRQINSLQE